VSPPIRVALLGYGLAGAVFHAPLIASVEGLELAAIVTHDEERRARARRDHPNAALLGSPEEVWERVGDLDLVVVAAANRAHVPLARSSIEAGLAVVVDKPLAASAGEGRSLVRDARERGVMLTVFQNRRWDGDFLTVRGLLEEGPSARSRASSPASSAGGPSSRVAGASPVTRRTQVGSSTTSVATSSTRRSFCSAPPPRCTRSWTPGAPGRRPTTTVSSRCCTSQASGRICG